MPNSSQVIALLFLNFIASASLAQDPTREEVARQAKEATGLLEVANGFSHGSAFCVHADGWFVTNAHVVGGMPDVKLILHPGLKTQQVLKARVIRIERETDLALLKAEGKAKFTPLPLGSTTNLAELTEIVAAGFPFGKGLALEKGAYPAVSVNTGRITALRLKDGQLERIQTDAALNPGNSGGPLLDLKGKVIGVVVSGVRGAAVNFAIPVDHLHRFVAAPQVEIEFPPIKYADRHKPAVFQVRTIDLVPAKDAYALDLILTDKDGAERVISMKPEAGVFRASAEAMKPTKNAHDLRVTLSYPSGTLHGLAQDCTFKVGGQEIKLSDLRTLRPGPKTVAVLQNGKILTGSLTDLDTLAVALGSDSWKVSPAKATEMTVQPSAPQKGVTYTIIVRRGDKEVTRVKDTLAFRDVPALVAPAIDAVKIGITPAILDRDATTVMLPSTVDDLAVGGGGRFLILHMSKPKQLAIFDVSLGKIVHTLPLSEDHVRFAAGSDKLIIAYPNSKIFQRYSLATFERETIKQLKLEGPVHTLAMGSASRGPIFVGGPKGPGDAGNCGVTFLDMNFGASPLPIKGHFHVNFRDDAPFPVRAAANGRVFTTWGQNSNMQSFVIESDAIQINARGDWAGSLVPGHDGATIFSTRLGHYTAYAKPIEGTARSPRLCSVPAHGYPYHLSFRYLDPALKEKESTTGVTVHLAGDGRTLAYLPHVDEASNRDKLDNAGRGVLTADKRLHFIPDAKLIITLPYQNDRLVLHRFDMDDALIRADFDYLFVTSSPPTTAKAGESFNYQITVKSKVGGVAYKLVTAPDGMTITPDGAISWLATTAAETEVLVAISDASRQEIFHAFKIRR